MYSISNEFKNFIHKDCQRGDFIQNYLLNFGIEAPAINVNGKKHIYVKFNKSQYDNKYPIKTVLAHYDRVESSPGANDNSSSVFLLMEWAVRLSKKSSPHNIRLLFTDGEELGGDGVKSQGAYDLAQLFKKLGLIDDLIFVFDCMGRGNIPVICKTTFSDSVSEDFINQYKNLELKTEKLLTSATGQYVKLPASYSDNAGFIANGIPAIAVTMLPFDEISLYKKGLQLLSENPQSDISKFIPKTWKMFHTMDDSYENLNPEAFEQTEKILDLLALLK